MALKWILFSSLFFSVLLQPRIGSTVDPADLDSWSALERQTLHLLKRFSQEKALSASAPLEKKVAFYLDAGLWSSAEALLSPFTKKEGERLWLELSLRRGEYERLYDAYRRDPRLFLNQPIFMLAASQGALIRKEYREALALLDPLASVGRYAPQRFYLSAIAYWGLKDKVRFDETLQDAMAWSQQHLGSFWSGRLHLLKVYYHLSLKEYDLAFLNVGEVFNQNADLALLGLGWGYSEQDAPDNLFSILEGFELDLEKSVHYSQFFQILSRFMIGRGDLPAALEIDQREREALRKQVETLEKEMKMVRDGATSPSNPTPPGSLLKKSLLKLQREVGLKKEISLLLQRLDLLDREQAIVRLRQRERKLEEEVERLRREIDRRCLSLVNLPFNRGKSDPLYHQARLAADQGKTDEVEKILKKLIQNPQSIYFEESLFRLGDLAFSRGEYEKAHSYYRILMDRPASYLYRSALYKSAWAYYLQGKVKEVIPLLFKERALLEKDPRQASPCRATQAPHERREQLRLFALSLQAEGGPARLAEWVHEKPAEASFSLFSDLARYYESAGRRKEMLQTIDAWRAAYPLYVETPFLHQMKIEAFNRPDLSDRPEAFQARVEFIEAYRPGGRWAENNPTEVTAKIRPLIKSHLRFLMNHYYLEARKTERVALYPKALPFYQQYLALFSSEEEAGETFFSYAELLNELREEKKAAEAYHASGYQAPPHPGSAEAAYREVVLREKLASPSQAPLEELYTRFIRSFPSDKRIPQIYLKQAEQAFQKGEYEKSRQMAQVASLQADQEGCAEGSQKICQIGWVAQRLTAQAYLKEGNYTEAIDLLKLRLSAPSLDKSSLSKEVEHTHSLLVLAYYQQGEALKQGGDLMNAANTYWLAYQQGKKMELGPLALFEAAALWETLDARDRAEEVLLLFQKEYAQKSTLSHSVLLRLGTLYEKSGRFDQAAEKYESAGRLPVDSALVLQALEHAISVYQGMRRWEKVYQLASQASERSQKGKEIEWIVIGAQAKLMLGQERVARNMLGEAIRMSKPRSAPKKGERFKEPHSLHLATAYLLLADIERKQFEEIRLVAPLEQNLQKKKTLFNRLLHAYEEAASNPSPAILLTATLRIGEVFEAFSDALLKSERPRDLAAEERKMYENLLKEQALPYIQRAHEAYQQNINWGRSTGVENEWVVKSEERIRSLNQQIESLFQTEGVSRG
jgi:lipopolysaccharide biosynthesis regulator YciM